MLTMQNQSIQYINTANAQQIYLTKHKLRRWVCKLYANSLQTLSWLGSRFGWHSGLFIDFGGTLLILLKFWNLFVSMVKFNQSAAFSVSEYFSLTIFGIFNSVKYSSLRETYSFITVELKKNAWEMLENYLVPSWAQWPDVEKNNGKLSAIDFCQSHIETHLTQCISLLLILRFLWCSILKYEFKHQIFSNCLNLSRGFFFFFFMPICCFTKFYETNELFLIKLVNLFDLTCWIVHSFA